MDKIKHTHTCSPPPSAYQQAPPRCRTVLIQDTIITHPTKRLPAGPAMLPQGPHPGHRHRHSSRSRCASPRHTCLRTCRPSANGWGRLSAAAVAPASAVTYRGKPGEWGWGVAEFRALGEGR